MEAIIESFERWFHGYNLTNNDTTIIILDILMGILLIAFVILLSYISIQSLFWTRIGWAFEELWHRIDRHSKSFFKEKQENLTDEEIQEIMGLINQSDSSKYKIRRKISCKISMVSTSL